MWSVGLILFELLHLLEENLRKEEPSGENQLLRGDYCYPLSPRASDSSDEEEDGADQLKLVLDRVGFKSESEMSFITNEITYKHVRNLMKDSESPVNFDALFPHADK